MLGCLELAYALRRVPEYVDGKIRMRIIGSPDLKQAAENGLNCRMKGRTRLAELAAVVFSAARSGLGHSFALHSQLVMLRF